LNVGLKFSSFAFGVQAAKQANKAPKASIDK